MLDILVVGGVGDNYLVVTFYVPSRANVQINGLYTDAP